jgi:hypothetical protein
MKAQVHTLHIVFVHLHVITKSLSNCWWRNEVALQIPIACC